MTDKRIFEDAESVAEASAIYLASEISRIVAEQGFCSVVLPGGSTPKRCLQFLATMELPWEQTHWYLNDERCLPVGDDERNDKMVLESLFSEQAALIESHFHPIPAHLGPEEGASAYAEVIDEIVARYGALDIVVFGMGEDGHTASLFPGNPALQDQRTAVPVYDSPKPPPTRVSVGLLPLRDARLKIVLATGAGKKQVLAEVFAEGQLPVARVEPDVWFLDKAVTP